MFVICNLCFSFFSPVVQNKYQTLMAELTVGGRVLWCHISSLDYFCHIKYNMIKQCKYYIYRSTAWSENNHKFVSPPPHLLSENLSTPLQTLTTNSGIGLRRRRRYKSNTQILLFNNNYILWKGWGGAYHLPSGSARCSKIVPLTEPHVSLDMLRKVVE